MQHSEIPVSGLYDVKHNRYYRHTRLHCARHDPKLGDFALARPWFFRNMFNGVVKPWGEEENLILLRMCESSR